MGKLNAVGNGNQQSKTYFKGNITETFLGKCLAIIQSSEKVGDIIVKAECDGIPDNEIIIQAK